MDQQELEIYFKHLLIDLGINQTEAAEIMGLSQQSLWAKIKRGTIRFAEMETLMRHFGKTFTK